MKIENVAKIDAYLVQTVRLLPGEAEGHARWRRHLLDHCLILYGSSICDGNAHTHHDLPLVLAGGGGGPVEGRPSPSLCQGNADE